MADESEKTEEPAAEPVGKCKYCEVPLLVVGEESCATCEKKRQTKWTTAKVFDKKMSSINKDFEYLKRRNREDIEDLKKDQKSRLKQLRSDLFKDVKGLISEAFTAFTVPQPAQSGNEETSSNNVQNVVNIDQGTGPAGIDHSGSGNS